MSEPENFLERWSRLKQHARLEESVGEKASTDPGGVEDSPTGDAPPIDLASLPPVESIGPETDIRPFLQAGVPEELTGAALRSAWVADPSIRNFVEMADNQWDFNDASAMPGFGSLGSAEFARELVNKALQGLDDVAEALPPAKIEAVDPATQADVVVAGPKVVDPVWVSGAGSAGASGSAVANPALVQAAASNSPSVPASKQSHGSALPK